MKINKKLILEQLHPQVANKFKNEALKTLGNPKPHSYSDHVTTAGYYKQKVLDQQVQKAKDGYLVHNPINTVVGGHEARARKSLGIK
ncbi:MAG: hypothetical protein WC136_08920 [Sphaerochaeta sp.]|jgi:hypothetical protein